MENEKNFFHCGIKECDFYALGYHTHSHWELEGKPCGVCAFGDALSVAPHLRDAKGVHLPKACRRVY